MNELLRTYYLFCVLHVSLSLQLLLALLQVCFEWPMGVACIVIVVAPALFGSAHIWRAEEFQCPRPQTTY